MTSRKPTAPPETFTLKSNVAAEAAEAMAQAHEGDISARAAYSRLLFEQSRSFGDYIRQKVRTTTIKKAS